MPKNITEQSECFLFYQELLKTVKTLTCSLADFLQSVRQLELSLDLGSQLLHFPPTFRILSPVRPPLLEGYFVSNGL